MIRAFQGISDIHLARCIEICMLLLYLVHEIEVWIAWQSFTIIEVAISNGGVLAEFVTSFILCTDRLEDLT